MAKNPKLDWFVNDWLTDPCVQRSSMAARGCWHEMLQYMAQIEPFEELRNPEGSPMSIADIADLLYQSKGSVSRWLKELERNGVFSRTEDGAIYNRRMVRARQNGPQNARQKRKPTPKSTDREHVSDQQLNLEISDTPRRNQRYTKTQTQAATLPPETPSSNPEPSSDSPTPRASDDQVERQNQQEQSSGEARCARLGGPAGPPPKARVGPRGQPRGRPPPCDLRARAARRHQIIVNLVEWLKINTLGSADKQLAARQMLGRARLALDDWKA